MPPKSAKRSWTVKLKLKLELKKILLEKFDVKSNLRKKDKRIELVKKYQNMPH